MGCPAGKDCSPLQKDRVSYIRLKCASFTIRTGYIFNKGIYQHTFFSPVMHTLHHEVGTALGLG